MAVTITGEYTGNKRVKLTHEPSGASFLTDAPKDNNGLGESFSPTDLLASGLGACAMTILGIVAEWDKIDLSGMHMKIQKEMSSSPRRIEKLTLEIHLPASIDQNLRPKLEKAALECPVYKSLHPDIQIPTKFIYDC